VFGDFLVYFLISLKFCHLNPNQKNPNFAILKEIRHLAKNITANQWFDLSTSL
jgi:hypothetical protein